TGGRLDCTSAGVRDSVSHDRLRGIRIFDITDITNPKYVANVQTCRGSHTHTVVIDPNDSSNVYVYVSGSAPVRSPTELPGCVRQSPDSNPNSSLFRIEVIKVPLAAPQTAAIVSSPRIFDSLAPPPQHGEMQQDIDEAKRVVDSARAHGGYVARLFGQERVVSNRFVTPMLDSIVKARGGTGAATAADSQVLRDNLQGILDRLFQVNQRRRTGPTQCHDYDNPHWGADALFTLENGQMQFQSYYKMLAPQTANENCVAHNGSLIPIPGRDIMVQSWYQGGISIFDWTDPAHPKEIAF